jgi:hypothetical protein
MLMFTCSGKDWMQLLLSWRERHLEDMEKSLLDYANEYLFGLEIQLVTASIAQTRMQFLYAVHKAGH